MGMPKKFGMFIHWGIYSLLGYHEQIRWRFYTPKMQYRKLADRFNPTDFDADEIVRLAKDAGMEYICFTTKHHDGFCMWDTKTTDFCITNTPYKKDILKELADACERHGVALSLYYSNPDWDYEYGYNSASTHQMPQDGQKENLDKFREFQKAQIKELLTNYGKIYTFFWDIPTRVEDKSMNEYVRSLQPDILINDRGWGDEGDFSTPERNVPEGSKFERYTEACQSVGHQSWGYCADEDYYTTRFLTASIDKIRVMDGSYLLNVGPMANGKLPEPAREIIERVGDWYNRVKEGFEGEPSPELLDNKSLLAVKNGSTLYVHIPKGLDYCGLTLKPIDVMPKSVTLLNSGEPLKFGIVTRPEDKDWKVNILRRQSLHLFDIPVEKYYSETLVIKIELDEGKIEL